MPASTRASSFDPASVDVLAALQTITGFAEGTFVEIVRDADSWTSVTGANGEVTRIKTNNLSATITITLVQGSESNLVLSALNTVDEASGKGVFPISIIDNSGGSKYIGAKAWILKPADVTFSSAHENRVWMIKVAQLIMVTTGNTEI